VGLQHRGSALGAYSVFVDVALGLSGPVLGLLSQAMGYGATFLAAGLCAAAGSAFCLVLAAKGPAPREALPASSRGS
jgi:predicted MFS family arabinose efflux permease